MLSTSAISAAVSCGGGGGLLRVGEDRRVGDLGGERAVDPGAIGILLGDSPRGSIMSVALALPAAEFAITYEVDRDNPPSSGGDGGW